MEEDNITQKPNGSHHIREYFTLWIESLEKVIDERDRRYEERFKAQETATEKALVAAEKLNRIVAESSEKAIAKAEAAQTVYNIGHNDLTRKMDSQYKEMIPRHEHQNDIYNINEKIDELKRDIQNLRESRSETGGKEKQGTSDQTRQQWTFMAVVAIINIALFLILNFAIK